jgi:hypothetical protein
MASSSLPEQTDQPVIHRDRITDPGDFLFKNAFSKGIHSPYCDY